MSRFDLVDILQAIFRKKKFIILFTLAAVVVALVWGLLQTKQYTSRSVFIVKGMATMDRNQMFRQTAFPNKDFFASEDEIDYIVTIAKSDNLRGYIAENFNLAEAYGTTDKAKISKKIKKNFKFTRNDTKNLETFFTDTDPKRAQAINQAATKWIEDNYRRFFAESSKDVFLSLQQKVATMDTSLQQLEDSIAILRTQYGLYSQLLPVRGKAINTSAGTASAQQAAGLEELQHLTSLKDQLIADRAAFHSLMNEYYMGLNNEHVNMFYYIQDADLPEEASFPKLWLILAVALVAGFFFSCILVVLQASAQQINKQV